MDQKKAPVVSPEKFLMIKERFMGGQVVVHQKSYAYSGRLTNITQRSTGSLEITYDQASSGNMGLSGDRKMRPMTGEHREFIAADDRIQEEEGVISFLRGDRGIVEVRLPL